MVNQIRLNNEALLKYFWIEYKIIFRNKDVMKIKYLYQSNKKINTNQEILENLDRFTSVRIVQCERRIVFSYRIRLIKRFWQFSVSSVGNLSFRVFS